MAITGAGSQNVVPEYVMDHLDTSFKVVLINSVKRTIDKQTGSIEIYIPDYQGLMKKIALCRASSSRKLASNDIRFLRKTLELSSKGLAEKLDITAEHLSRCEGGERTLSANSEKMLRLMIMSEPLMVIEKAVEQAGHDSRKKLPELLPLLSNIREIISDMRIESVHDADCELTFKFTHKRHDVDGKSLAANEDEEGEWSAPALAA